MSNKNAQKAVQASSQAAPSLAELKATAEDLRAKAEEAKAAAQAADASEEVKTAAANAEDAAVAAESVLKDAEAAAQRAADEAAAAEAAKAPAAPAAPTTEAAEEDDPTVVPVFKDEDGEPIPRNSIIRLVTTTGRNLRALDGTLIEPEPTCELKGPDVKRGDWYTVQFEAGLIAVDSIKKLR